MDGIMNGGTDAVQHVAAPILGSFANFFGNSSNGDGETLSQGVYDEIVRASAAAAELAFEAATNQVTPQHSATLPREESFLNNFSASLKRT
eukprot:scaffold68800_cov112-Phaeocystis_antarctica.AAC.1